MDFILFAIGLGYLQAGSNQLRRDLGGGVLNQPIYMHTGGARLPHYIFAILLWPTIRLARRSAGSSMLRTLSYYVIEWTFAAILSGVLMVAVGLFTDEVATRALVVLGLYGFMLAGSILAYSKNNADHKRQVIESKDLQKMKMAAYSLRIVVCPPWRCPYLPGFFLPERGVNCVSCLGEACFQQFCRVLWRPIFIIRSNHFEFVETADGVSFRSSAILDSRTEQHYPVADATICLAAKIGGSLFNVRRSANFQQPSRV